jgi:hypothetical protein
MPALMSKEIGLLDDTPITAGIHCQYRCGVSLPAHQKPGSVLSPAQCLSAALTAWPAAVASTAVCALQLLAAAASTNSQYRRHNREHASQEDSCTDEAHSKLLMFASTLSSCGISGCACVWQWGIVCLPAASSAHLCLCLMQLLLEQTLLPALLCSILCTDLHSCLQEYEWQHSNMYQLSAEGQLLLHSS